MNASEIRTKLNACIFAFGRVGMGTHAIMLTEIRDEIEELVKENEEYKRALLARSMKGVIK